MHELIGEKLNEIYGDDNIDDVRVRQLISFMDEAIVDLEYVCKINKKLATHFLHEYTSTNEMLNKCKLRCSDLESNNKKLTMQSKVISLERKKR